MNESRQVIMQRVALKKASNVTSTISSSYRPTPELQLCVLALANESIKSLTINSTNASSSNSCRFATNCRLDIWMFLMTIEIQNPNPQIFKEGEGAVMK